MHRYRAPSIAPGTFFAAQSWADFIINMSEANLRQAQDRSQLRKGKIVLELNLKTDESVFLAVCDPGGLLLCAQCQVHFSILTRMGDSARCCRFELLCDHGLL